MKGFAVTLCKRCVELRQAGDDFKADCKFIELGNYLGYEIRVLEKKKTRDTDNWELNFRRY